VTTEEPEELFPNRRYSCIARVAFLGPPGACHSPTGSPSRARVASNADRAASGGEGWRVVAMFHGRRGVSEQRCEGSG
jgi:hypothetical protein